MIDNLGAAWIVVFLFDGDELFLDDAENLVFISKDSLEFLDKLVESLQLFFNLVTFETLETAKLHLKDGISLNLRETELLHELFICVVVSGTDGFDYFIDIIKCNFQTFQDMRTLFGLPKIKLGTAANHLLAVFNKLCQNLLETEDAWLNAIDKSEHIIMESSLKWGKLVELVQNLLREGIFL